MFILLTKISEITGHYLEHVVTARRERPPVIRASSAYV